MAPARAQGSRRGGGPAVSSHTPDYRLFLCQGTPYAELSLGGAKGLFLIDTGAGVSGVDRAWVKEHRVPFRPAGQGSVGGTTGALAVGRARFARLDLGTGFFKDPVLLLEDFSRFQHPREGPQVGLVGMDLLASYRLAIDYRRRRLRLALRAERRRLSLRRWGPTAVTMVRRIPTVNVRLAGLDLPCRLDTGAGYTRRGVLLDVNQAAVRALRAAGVRLEQTGSLGVLGVAGPERLPLLRAAHGRLTLALGPVRVSEVTLVVHARGTLAGPDPLALASASVLKRCGRLVLDPFDRLLWLPRGR